MTITSTEAAAILGLTTSGLRNLVLRDKLAPVRPGAHPLRFMREAVIELEWTRRSPAEKARNAEAARRLRSSDSHGTVAAVGQVRPESDPGAFRASGMSA